MGSSDFGIHGAFGKELAGGFGLVSMGPGPHGGTKVINPYFTEQYGVTAPTQVMLIAHSKVEGITLDEIEATDPKSWQDDWPPPRGRSICPPTPLAGRVTPDCLSGGG